jgi:hypothetical protein
VKEEGKEEERLH